MRTIAEELEAYAELLEGTWGVEIGPSGPVLAMRCPSKRREGAVRRIREQLDEQLLTTHPGYICANGPEIEHPSIGRMRRPDAVVIPEDVLDEEGLAVDATQVLAVIEIVSPSNLLLRRHRRRDHVDGPAARPRRIFRFLPYAIVQDASAEPEYEARCVSGDDADRGAGSGPCVDPAQVEEWQRKHTQETRHTRYRRSFADCAVLEAQTRG